MGASATSQAGVILVPGLSHGNLALSGSGSAAIAYTYPAGMALPGEGALSASVDVMAYDVDYYSQSGSGDAPN